MQGIEVEVGDEVVFGSCATLCVSDRARQSLHMAEKVRGDMSLAGGNQPSLQSRLVFLPTKEVMGVVGRVQLGLKAQDLFQRRS